MCVCYFVIHVLVLYLSETSLSLAISINISLVMKSLKPVNPILKKIDSFQFYFQLPVFHEKNWRLRFLAGYGKYILHIVDRSVDLCNEPKPKRAKPTPLSLSFLVFLSVDISAR